MGMTRAANMNTTCRAETRNMRYGTSSECPAVGWRPVRLWSSAGRDDDGVEDVLKFGDVISDSTGRDAVIYACSVDQPSEPRVTVDFFGVNGGRSWPGFGDVSWQPILSGS
jgi:hypothetical protein